MVSVIIPIYNAEKYIRCCLDSVVNQTNKDLDIIVVDDGSTDGSGAICDEYAAKDNRFHVIHQKNRGVSVARQIGLDAVKGDYFCFVDADDWVEHYMVEEMKRSIEEADADMVIGYYFTETREGWQLETEEINSSLTADSYLSRVLSYKSIATIWGKLYRSSFFSDVKFEPIDLCWGEDSLFLIRVLKKSPKLSFIDKGIYYYRKVESSLTNDITKKKLMNRLSFISHTEKLLNEEQKRIFTIYKIQFLKEILKSGYVDLLKVTLPEVHSQAIKGGIPYRIHFPLSSCLSIALRGKPTLAYWLYRFNMFLINISKIVRRYQRCQS